MNPIDQVMAACRPSVEAQAARVLQACDDLDASARRVQQWLKEDMERSERFAAEREAIRAEYEADPLGDRMQRAWGAAREARA